MAVMSSEQQNLLRSLEHARETYEVFETDLAERVSQAKWDAKAGMRELVREALKAGVPYRQIGIALKTSDHQTLKQYERDIRR